MNPPGSELLQVLIATAESRNLTEAAAKLQISQPAVSVKLQALERITPLPLFQLEGKRKVLTHYGRELYNVAKASARHAREGFESLNRRYSSAENLRLRIGARKELFETITPRLRFQGRIEFTSMSSAEAVAKLQRHEVDIALAYPPLIPDSAEIVARKILESVSQFAVHRSLVPRGEENGLMRNVDYLLRTPCVIYEGGGHSLRHWARHLGIPFEKLRVSAVAEDWRIVRKLIDEGWGYGIVPAHIPSSAKNVLVIPTPTSVLEKYTFYALFHRDLKKVPAFREVLEFRER